MYTNDLSEAERRWRGRSLFKRSRPRYRLTAALVVVALVVGVTLVAAQWGGLDVFALVN